MTESYSTCKNPYPFIYPKAEKGTNPFWIEPPLKGHYRDN